MQIKFEKFEEEAFTSKGGKKMNKGTLVGKTVGQYADLVVFTVWDDNARYSASQLGSGAIVDVKFNIKSREWTSPQGKVKYFTDAVAYQLEKVSDGEPAARGNTTYSPPANNQPQTASVEDDGADDLPF